MTTLKLKLTKNGRTTYLPVYSPREATKRQAKAEKDGYTVKQIMVPESR